MIRSKIVTNLFKKPINNRGGAVSSMRVAMKAANPVGNNGTLYSYSNKYKVLVQSEILLTPENQKILAIHRRIINTTKCIRYFSKNITTLEYILFIKLFLNHNTILVMDYKYFAIKLLFSIKEKTSVINCSVF